MLKQVLVAISALTTVVSPARAGASESDPGADRARVYPDAGAAADAVVNRLLDEAVRRANRWGGRCREGTLRWYIEEVLEGDVYGGPVEREIEAGRIPHIMIPLAESYLRGLRPRHGAWVLLASPHAWMPTVRMHRDGVALNIGADKFGHFFTQGLAGFRRWRWFGYSSERVVRWAYGTEQQWFGWITTGVLSYADVYADYLGMLWWANLVEKRIAAGPEPYFACDGHGRWTRVREFHWSEYVDAAWDEGINCNEYTRAVRSVVDANNRADSAAHGRPMACTGTDPGLEPIHARLGELAGYMIHAPGSVGRPRTR